MSYQQAMRHRPHRLNMGHTFNPSGVQYVAPRERPKSAVRRAQEHASYRRALAVTVRAARLEGRTNAEIRAWRVRA